MSRTYRSTIELRNAVLRKDDVIIFSFREGPPLTYGVTDCGLAHKGNATLKVFTILNISPTLLAAEAYGYQPLRMSSSDLPSSPHYDRTYNSWPLCKHRDYKALTRLVFMLMSHTENDFLRGGEDWVMSYNEKRRLEMTGATLSPRPRLMIEIGKDSNGIKTQKTMIDFAGKRYTMEEWEALKTLHQVTRLPAGTNTEVINTNFNINNKQENESIIVRNAPRTISTGKGSRGITVSCGRNRTTISFRKDSNQKGPFKSQEGLKCSKGRISFGN